MKCFFDTNVLVYLFDAESASKRKRARELFQRHADLGDIVLSTQVLQEFYVVVTRQLKPALDSAAAEGAVQAFAEFPLVQIDGRLILAAIQRSRRWKNAFWDALIIQSAIEGSATTLYSEDLQHDQWIDGLRVINPFT